MDRNKYKNRNSNNHDDEFINVAKEKINSINFEKLNEDVFKTIDSAISIAKTGFNKYENFINSFEQKDNYKYPTKNPSVLVQAPKNSSKSIIFRILGITGLGINITCALGMILAMFIVPDLFEILMSTTITWILPWTLLSAYLYKKGNDTKKLNMRYTKYVNALHSSTIALVKELALSVHKNVEFTKKDLKKLMTEGYFHQARLVENEEIFILDHQSYEQYKNYLVQNPTILSDSESKTSDYEPLNKSFTDASRYLNEIVVANKKIQNLPFKINTEDIVKTAHIILARAKEKPEELSALRKFFDYYLPTVKKLVINYQIFEEKELEGEEVISAMNDIEGSLDVINLAFKKLLNNLFSETAVDVQAELKVLKNILNQDGLIDGDFKINREDTK